MTRHALTMKTGPQDQDNMRTQPIRRHRHRVRHLWRLRHLRCKLHPHLHRRAERQLSVRRRQVPHKVQGYRVQGLRRLRCRGTEQWSPFDGLNFFLEMEMTPYEGKTVPVAGVKSVLLCCANGVGVEGVLWRAWFLASMVCRAGSKDLSIHLSTARKAAAALYLKCEDLLPDALCNRCHVVRARNGLAAIRPGNLAKPRWLPATLHGSSLVLYHAIHEITNDIPP